MKYPDRVYLLSDTFGGDEQWNPRTSPDIDALITTDIRSRVKQVRREFDIFGSEAISDHILRTVLRLRRENQDGSTGIFINHAGRTIKGKNGEPFYVAEVGDGIRVVATPLTALSAIRDEITSLSYLPNEGENGLYDTDREQFRSSFTPRLLALDHELPLTDDDPKIIPEYPDGTRLAYADRFGNLVLKDHRNSQNVQSLQDEIRTNIDRTIRLKIGNVALPVSVGTSLKDAPPGSIVIFPNDGNIDVIAKWTPDTDAREKLKRSAYAKFGAPKIGAPVSIL